ncbi:RNA polymerase sigma factor [Brucellaceae bacterium C25G]
MNDIHSDLDVAFIKIQNSLFQKILSIARDRSVAEELTQEVYIRALSAFKINTPVNIEAFLWTTAKNLAFDYLRRKKVRSNTVREADMDGDLTQLVDNAVSAEEQMIQNDRIILLRHTLAKLPSRVQKVWFLSRIKGWSYPKIAEYLDISPNTVFNDIKIAMAALHRLRKKL